MRNEKPKTRFDPDFGPSHPTNKQAAKDHGLRWDPRRQVYVDSEGFMVRDKFGQPF